VLIDGGNIFQESKKLNADGELLVEFILPNSFETGEGVLSVTIEDGGVVESRGKTIPLIMNVCKTAFF
jgi:hypothetical protein